MSIHIQQLAGREASCSCTAFPQEHLQNLGAPTNDLSLSSSLPHLFQTATHQLGARLEEEEEEEEVEFKSANSGAHAQGCSPAIHPSWTLSGEP